MASKKMHKRALIFLIVLIFVFASMLSTAQAIETILYQWSSDPDMEQAIGPEIGHGAGASEIHGGDQYLTRVDAYLKKDAAGTGSITMAVMNSSNRNITACMETSNDIYDLSAISTSYSWVTFDFDGTLLLNSSVHYDFIVYAVEANSVGLKWQRALNAGASAYTCAYVDYYYYQSVSSPSIYIKVYHDSVAGSGEGTTGWQVTNTDELIEDVAGFLVPIVVMLLPAIILIVFFKRTDKWLILIGLAMGTGLGYYFGMVPVWLVFLVAIGLIGLAYSEVRRNG